MASRLFLPFCAAALLSGCATVGLGGDDERAPEFVGRTMRVQAASGQVSTLSFAPNGDVHATYGKRSTHGRWRLDDGELCFTWAGDFRECWPRARPFQRGRTATLTSSRGNVVKVTLL